MHNPCPTVEQYSRELMEVLPRALRAAARHGDVDDAVQEIAERFARNPQGVMEAFPAPADFAWATARNSWIGHCRRQAAQRGEGWLRSREVSVGTDSLVGLPDTESVEWRVECKMEADRVLAHEPVGDRALLFRVHGMGHEIQQVAGEFGVRRETLSRRLSSARAHARLAAGAVA